MTDEIDEEDVGVTAVVLGEGQRSSIGDHDPGTAYLLDLESSRRSPDASLFTTLSTPLAPVKAIFDCRATTQGSR